MTLKQIAEASTTLGLTRQSASGTMYGELDGFPAQLCAVRKNNAVQIVALLRFNADGRAEDVQRALAESPELAAAGVEKKHVTSDADSVALTFAPRVFRGLPGADVIVSRVRAALDVLKRAVPGNRRACRQCGAVTAEPALVRGAVDYLCSGCGERLEQEGLEVQKAYAAKPLNLPLGLAASLLAGALGAATYGGVMVATEKMYWMLAILTGVIVGWAAVKGSGKGGMVVQAMAGVVTVVSVLAGLLVFIGYIVNKQAVAEGNTVDWLAFARASPRILFASGSDALFSLGGGLLGAYYAIRKASPPDFKVVG